MRNSIAIHHFQNIDFTVFEKAAGVAPAPPRNTNARVASIC
jgi:hypothetical protein